VTHSLLPFIHHQTLWPSPCRYSVADGNLCVFHAATFSCMHSP
jgi:hypothetical protein